MTRMWMVEPKLMCRQHLLGEHKEIHQLLGTLNHNISIDGYVRNGLIETHNIKNRHDSLVKEMIKRGYNHKTPIQNYPLAYGHVDRKKSIIELVRRCDECSKRIKNG